MFPLSGHPEIQFCNIIRKEGGGEGPAKTFLIWQISFLRLIKLKGTVVLLAELATPTLSRPEQASQWANQDNEYTKMKLQPRSIILDGSWEPLIVPNDEL